jgi:trehalose-phosphatase
MLSSRSRELVSRAFDIFKHRLNGLPGVRIEDKELTFALHTRGASPEATRSARALLRRTVASFQPGLHVLRGEKIWEVLPREVPGKGEFVRRVLQRASGSFLSVYVGDDDTDESAFAVLPRGITVRVGPGRRTRARYRLRDPGEVRAFLERAEGELR